LRSPNWRSPPACRRAPPRASSPRSSGAGWSNRTGSAAACARDPRSCAELSGETINLAVPGSAGVEHLLQVDGRHFLGVGHWVGRTVDFHCTANGKVFLAFDRVHAPAGASTIAAHTQATIIDQDALKEELSRVRRDGYAAAVDELELGLAAIAAPVRGASGEVVAALSITGPTVRMTPARIKELWPELVQESDRLSERLGHIEEGAHAA
jgi:IclR family transcriptional regulator, acetate operon repressor